MATEGKRNSNTPLKILEYGLGTGFNALLTYIHSNNQSVDYTGVEAFPVSLEEALAMDYGSLLQQEELYQQIHEISWEEPHELRDSFTLTKRKLNFHQIEYQEEFDLIYFDAFGPRVQPELWSVEIFQSAFKALNKNGILTTYCAQGQARRNMIAAGFTVERLPGPPGKREMLRATK